MESTCIHPDPSPGAYQRADLRSRRSFDRKSILEGVASMSHSNHAAHVHAERDTARAGIKQHVMETALRALNYNLEIGEADSYFVVFHMTMGRLFGSQNRDVLATKVF